MAMALKKKPVTGMKDITPAEMEIRDYVIGLQEAENGKTAVMYTVAYLYEHWEEADHHALNLTLRALLFGSRKEAF